MSISTIEYTEPNDLERLTSIVAAINSFCYETMGLRTAEPKPLAELSLREMIDAVDAVKAWNARPNRTSAHMVPDDRLTAAVYCWLHYSGTRRAFEPAGDELVLVASERGKKKFLIIGLRDPSDIVDGDEEAED